MARRARLAGLAGKARQCRRWLCGQYDRCPRQQQCENRRAAKCKKRHIFAVRCPVRQHDHDHVGLFYSLRLSTPSRISPQTSAPPGGFGFLECLGQACGKLTRECQRALAIFADIDQRDTRRLLNIDNRGPKNNKGGEVANWNLWFRIFGSEESRTCQINRKCGQRASRGAPFCGASPVPSLPHQSSWQRRIRPRQQRCRSRRSDTGTLQTAANAARIVSCFARRPPARAFKVRSARTAGARSMYTLHK